MEQTTITQVNNVGIVVYAKEQLVPIRPICDALGIDSKSQRQRIYEDEILSAVGVLCSSTGKDGKTYEMLCLPVQYAYGWLFSISVKHVAPETRGAVIRYKKECYDALYRYFNGMQRRQLEQNTLEIRLLEEVADISARQMELKRELAEKKKQIEALRSERLRNEATLFD